MKFPEDDLDLPSSTPGVSNAEETAPVPAVNAGSGTVTTTTMPPDLQALLRRLEQDPTVHKQHIVEETNTPVAVTVAELRSAITNNPSHLKAYEFSKGIAGMAGAKTVFVDQPDLIALIHNKQVVTRLTTVNGVTRKVKSVE